MTTVRPQNSRASFPFIQTLNESPSETEIVVQTENMVQTENRDVRQKLAPFLRRWPLVAFIVLAISGLTYYHYLHQPKTYAASAQIYVRPGGASPIVGSDTEGDPLRRLLNEAAFLQSPAVAAKVAQQLDFKGDPRDLLSLITVTPSSSSDLISVAATTSDPNRSAALANDFASAYVALSTPQTGRTPPGAQLINRATPPIASEASSPARNAFFAGILGLVLASMVILGLEAFDRRLRHSAMEAEYGLPLLASIPFSRKAQGAIRAGSGLPVALMERVRGLRTMLDHGAGSEAAPRTVLVTSAIPGEGKSTLVKSLALAYFESAKSVLVIDADLRRPMLHEFFDAPLVPGLSDVLRSSILLPDAVQKVQSGDIQPAFDPVLAGFESTMSVVPQRGHPLADSSQEPARGNVGDFRGPVLDLLASGSGTSDPAALLGSPQLKTLLTEAAATYDLVLIDSAPVLSVSDAIPLATAADAVIVVARSEFTTRDAALRCREALERVPTASILGVVANAVRNDDQLSRQYYTARS